MIPGIMYEESKESKIRIRDTHGKGVRLKDRMPTRERMMEKRCGRCECQLRPDTIVNKRGEEVLKESKS